MLAQFIAASIAAPAIIILAACSTPQTAPIRTFCALTTEPTLGGTQITATVTPASDIAGFYSLQVSGSGTGNTALIDQGGAFEAAAGTTLTLGQVTLSGANLTSQLTITAAGTTTSCPTVEK